MVPRCQDDIVSTRKEVRTMKLLRTMCPVCDENRRQAADTFDLRRALTLTAIHIAARVTAS
jgi:hypothetical protein